jgi:hypothetical protein
MTRDTYKQKCHHLNLEPERYELEIYRAAIELLINSKSQRSF